MKSSRGNKPLALAALSVAVGALMTVGTVQAQDNPEPPAVLKLSCAPGGTAWVRDITTNRVDWSSNAVLASDDETPAELVDDYIWSGWFDPGEEKYGPGNDEALPGKWISYGVQTPAGGDTAGQDSYPVVNTNPSFYNTETGRNGITFLYNTPIEIGPNVNLASIHVVGNVGMDDSNSGFVVIPENTPAGAEVTEWVRVSSAPGTYGSVTAIDLDGNAQGLGFNHGLNQVGFVVRNGQNDTSTFPTGLYADIGLEADCSEPEPIPEPESKVLFCPAGIAEGEEVRIGTFYSNINDWTWTHRWNRNADGDVDGAQGQWTTGPFDLFEGYRYTGWQDPTALVDPNDTPARWISPGTTQPGNADIPGLPYPEASGQAKNNWNASVFAMNEPIYIGSNVKDVRLQGRSAFGNYGDNAFLAPDGQPLQPTNLQSSHFHDGSSLSNENIPLITDEDSFVPGWYNVGVGLSRGPSQTSDNQYFNTCDNGNCALGMLIEFDIVGTCTGEEPKDDDVNPSDPEYGVIPGYGGDTGNGENDGGANDGGANDGGANDGGANDGGANDGGANDGGANDGGANDGGANDGGANDGGAAGPGDASITSVPTLDFLGLGALAGLLGGMGAWFARRRRQHD